MEKEFVSVDGVAEEFSVSRSTAWKWIRDRAIETYRFVGDRKTYVRRSDVETIREPMLIDPTKKTSPLISMQPERRSGTPDTGSNR